MPRPTPDRPPLTPLRFALLAFAVALVLGAARPEASRAQDFEEPEVEAGDKDGPKARKFFSIGVRGGLWLAALEGDITFVDGGALEDVLGGSFPGASIDLEDDLDLDTVSPVPWAEVFITLKYVNIYLSYWQTRFEGEETIERQIAFGSFVFGVNERVETDVDILSVAGKIQVNPIAFEHLEVGIIFGVRYFHFDATLESTLTGRESETLEAPIPLVGLSASIFVGLFEVGVKVCGIGFTSQDLDVLYLEGEATVTFTLPLPIDAFDIGVGGGYFLYLIDIEDEDDGDEVDVSFHGPMAFLRVRF